VSDSLLHFLLEERKERILLVLHHTALDTKESSLEGLLLDGSISGGIFNGLLDLVKGTESDLSKVVSKILVLEVLNHLQHVVDSAVEVMLNVQLLVCKVVNESSLLNVVVFRVDADVLHLFFGLSQVSELFLLGNISPHTAELLSLISGVDIVEDGELGTDEVGEVSDLNVSEIESEQELVMEDHASDPLVVGPSTETRNGVDSTNVEEDEQETSSAS
jgi:hypothetical protein